VRVYVETPMYRAVHHLRRTLHDALDSVVALAECLAFWCTIVLPFMHVPLVVAYGLTQTTVPVLATLWTCNAVALLLGSRHSPSAALGPFGRQ
jgi:hypothetical protein